MIHGVPVKTYNALQNHIIVLLVDQISTYTEKIVQTTQKAVANVKTKHPTGNKAYNGKKKQ